MITTLLFDLDDTLLGNSMDVFLPGYFGQLARHFELGKGEAKRLVNAVLHGTDAMVANLDPTRALLGVFYDAFYPAMGWEPATYTPRFDDFYRTRFSKLQPLTQTRPAARAAMDWAFGAGYQVVIATSPLFPLAAIQERLRWAGVADFPYALVTAIETSHFTKPHPEYFAEILARLGKRPDEALVIGNDWEADLMPAAKLGLPHFWVSAPGNRAAPDNKAAADSAPPGNTVHPVGVGPLEAFLEWAPAHLPALAAPALPAPALPVLLSGNLAETAGLLADLPEAAWCCRPAAGEWSLVEIACHLRDVDHEVNLPRLQAVAENDNPFLPGADTDPWAVERCYQTQAGPQALAEWVEARRQTYTFLASLPEAAWRRPARHALLGNTTLAELVGWILDHDRIHLAQLRATRQKAIQ
jgi:FMN phosphatase YigB (HAD superfamily)